MECDWGAVAFEATPANPRGSIQGKKCNKQPAKLKGHVSAWGPALHLQDVQEGPWFQHACLTTFIGGIQIPATLWGKGFIPPESMSGLTQTLTFGVYDHKLAWLESNSSQTPVQLSRQALRAPLLPQSHSLEWPDSLYTPLAHPPRKGHHLRRTQKEIRQALKKEDLATPRHVMRMNPHAVCVPCVPARRPSSMS